MKILAAVLFAAMVAALITSLSASPKPVYQSTPYCPAPMVSPEGDIDQLTLFIACSHAGRYADI